MSRKQDKPTNSNRPEGTGVPSKISPGNLENDKQLTEKYTKDDEGIAQNVRQKNPNRNVDKLKSTNAGGYKN